MAAETTTRLPDHLVLDDDSPDLDLWLLAEDYDFEWRGRPLRVPAGTPTDGASIPRLCWRVVGHPMQRPLIRAAVPHDAAYGGRLTDWDGVRVYLTRAEADQMLRELSRLAGVSATKSTTVYYAVRWFGARNYRGSAPT